MRVSKIAEPFELQIEITFQLDLNDIPDERSEPDCSDVDRMVGMFDIDRAINVAILGISRKGEGLASQYLKTI